MVSALGKHDRSQYVLVRVETDAGIYGAGEATVTPNWSGETMWSAQAIIERRFAPALEGLDPLDLSTVDCCLDRLAFGNWFAKAAIEMACWDIWGKSVGQPVYELLGGAVRSRTIPCRFSMGAYPAERAERRARELVAKGFSTIKIKVGASTREEDIARVTAVRSAVGPGIDIVIDANCGFATAEDAIALARALEPLGVGLFEQPTPRDDYEALAQVRRATDMPVMADDTCFDLNHARLCAKFDACDVVSVYPGKSGGIGKAKAVIDYCESQRIACSIGSNLELDVGAAAMCHLVVASKNMRIEQFPGDIMGPDYHAECVVHEPLMIDGPSITVTNQPGLGVDVDWDKLATLGP